MPNLYEISNDYLDAIEVAMLYAEENDGVVEDAVASELEKIKMDRDEKVNNTAMYIKNLVGLTESIKAELESLTARKKKLENKINSLKNYIRGALGQQKFMSEKCEITYKTTVQTKVPDESKVPEEFAKTEIKEVRKVDKTAIKKHIKENGPVDYAYLEDNVTTYVK